MGTTTMVCLTVSAVKITEWKHCNESDARPLKGKKKVFFVVPKNNVNNFQDVEGLCVYNMCVYKT